MEGNNTPRFLITTALEETWKQDQPVVFLGKWCQRYERREIWEKMDGVVPVYHWTDYRKLERDYHYLMQLDEAMFSAFARWLNAYHQTDYSTRYWKILAGPWFTYFLHIVFERWESVNRTCDTYTVSGSAAIEFNEEDAVPTDMFHFVSLMVSDEWNHFITTAVVTKRIGAARIERVQPRPGTELSKQWKTHEVRGLKGKIVSRTLSALNKTLGLLNRRNKYFIGASYIGLAREIKLNLRLGQLPSYYDVVLPSQHKPDMASRRKMTFGFGAKTPFEQFFADFLPEQVPVCFLEGYHSLVKETARLSFPPKPKVIFTSNFLTYDSLAMAYTASQVEKGCRLVHGQHGGYGIPAFMNAFDHEILISDRYLVWGDAIKNTLGETTPVGILKPVDRYMVKGSPNNNHDLLVVRGLWPRYTFRLDSGVGLDLNDAIHDCIDFARRLPAALQEESLLVRLFPRDYGYGEATAWQTFSSSVRLDHSTPITKLVSASRLVVYTYNISTGFLEFFNADVPTIMFWDMKASPVSAAAEPYFDKLRKAGIFHDTPESAALHVQSVWNDVESWWTKPEVKKARVDFCSAFARPAPALVTDIEKILRDECGKAQIQSN